MRSQEQRMSGGLSRRHSRSVYFAALMWLIWLLYMGPVIASLLASHPSPARLVASLLGGATFIVLYVWVAWQSARKVVGAAPLPLSQSRLRLWLPILTLLALSLILTKVDGETWGALFIYTCAAGAGRLPVRHAAGLLVGIAALAVFYGWSLHLSTTTIVTNIMTIGLAGVTTMTVVWSVTTSRQLREERAEVARLAAVSEERLRIARDLHDLLGHNLSLIALKSELARRLVAVAPERAAAEIGDVEQAARMALQEVREAVAGYRQPSLVGELANAREVLAAAGIAYCYVGDERAGQGLPAAGDAALAWAVREGITNVIRHSHARSCTIRVVQQARELSVEITDDGVGATASPTETSTTGKTAGNGLRGLAERVETLGGRYEAGPGSTGGFRLCVAVPLERRADGKRAPQTQAAVASPVAPAMAAMVERGEGQTSA